MKGLPILRSGVSDVMDEVSVGNSLGGASVGALVATLVWLYPEDEAQAPPAQPPSPTRADARETAACSTSPSDDRVLARARPRPGSSRVGLAEACLPDLASPVSPNTPVATRIRKRGRLGQLRECQPREWWEQYIVAEHCS